MNEHHELLINVFVTSSTVRIVQAILFTEPKRTCTNTGHSHKATPKSSEEEVGCPDQKNLVITGKSASLSKGRPGVFSWLPKPKAKQKLNTLRNHTAKAYTRLHAPFPSLNPAHYSKIYWGTEGVILKEWSLRKKTCLFLISSTRFVWLNIVQEDKERNNTFRLFLFPCPLQLPRNLITYGGMPW